MPATAFVTLPALTPGRRLYSSRTAPRAPGCSRPSRLIVVAKKRGPKPSPPADDSFSGFAAGPSAASKPRLSHPKKPSGAEAAPETEPTTKAEPESELTKELEEADETSPSEQTDSAVDNISPPREEDLRAVRALGTTSTDRTGPEFVGRKTAEDFIAEGVVDDADDDVQAFEAMDIRFGIADVKDPFKEDETMEDAERLAAQQEQERNILGKPQDVTGDGGVSKRLVRQGNGEVVSKGATVRVEYTGRLEDGKEFDSSRGREGGFSFQLGAGAVIKGWEAGVGTMRVGEIAEFDISAAYAYGRRGMPPVIPGNSTLTFEIELVDTTGGEREDVKRVKDFNPEIARTPGDIARDYESRLETQEERKKGRSLLERFYFISPFMSQTGEKPPWWINPNITSVIIAVFTVIGFYLVVKSGAIHIGYVDQPIDVNIFK